MKEKRRIKKQKKNSQMSHMFHQNAQLRVSAKTDIFKQYESSKHKYFMDNTIMNPLVTTTKTLETNHWTGGGRVGTTRVIIIVRVSFRWTNKNILAFRQLSVQRNRVNAVSVTERPQTKQTAYRNHNLSEAFLV